MANILGVAHSTGYPLYLLIAKSFTLLPIGSPAWRVNLVSAVCAALSLPFVYLMAKRVSSSRAAAFIAATLFALAPTLWASAVEAEVYALNTLLLSVTLYFAVLWYDNHQSRYLYLTAFAFGLALDNHRVSLFIAPSLLLLFWFNRNWVNTRRLAQSAMLILLPLLLYVYIPVRASHLLQDQSPANWELYPRSEAMLKGTISAYYNNTPSGVLNLITGFDNRNKLGFQDTSTDSLTTRLSSSFLLLLQQFNPLALLLAFAGIVLVFRSDRRLAVFLLVWAMGIGGVSVALRAESTRFYFSGAYIVLALFFAAAASRLFTWSGVHRWLRLAVSAVLAILPAYTLWANFSAMNESDFNVYDTFARSILQDNLASNAVVIAPWELATGLRYLQFVEGRRPDLLIIHESPVRPQYQKLLASAHSLARPFYYVQFTPEDRAVPGFRTVQAVGLPLLTKPAPRYRLDANLTNAVRVLGYDLQPDPAMPGSLMRVMVYYQVVAPLTTQYIAGLDLADIRGEPHGDWQHPPVSEYYPTYFWKVGEYYRDVWDISLPADAPKGLYGLELSWYPFDPVTNATHYEQAQTISFGPIRAGDFGAGVMPSTQHANFSNGMTLLGYGLNSTGKSDVKVDTQGVSPIAMQRGQLLNVSLFWNASRQIQDAFTVFVHLDDARGVVRAQSDRPPWNGMFPTDRWAVGETVRDDFEIRLPSDLPAGDYALHIGLYRTPDKRVFLLTGGDELALSTRIRLTEP